MAAAEPTFALALVTTQPKFKRGNGMSRQLAQLLAGVLVLLAFLLSTASADVIDLHRIGHPKPEWPIPPPNPNGPPTPAACCCATVWACLVGAFARLCSCCRRPRPASPTAP